jgi:hypothetical protein
MTSQPAKKPANPNLITIDARAASYDGEAIRILAVTSVDTGKILVAKQDVWREQPIAKENTIVVTDTPNVFGHWGLAFNEKEQMSTVMMAYKAANAAGLLSLDDSLARYDPKNVIQTRKFDEKGRALDFDSMGMNNGHIAVLLAIWAARQAHGGYVITSQPDTSGAQEDDSEDNEHDMMPFSI